MELDDSFKLPLYLTRGKGRYLLTGLGSNVESSQKELQYSYYTPLGYFVIIKVSRDLRYTLVDAYICSCSIGKTKGRCLQMLWCWERSAGFTIQYLQVMTTCNMLFLNGEDIWPLVRYLLPPRAEPFEDAVANVSTQSFITKQLSVRRLLHLMVCTCFLLVVKAWPMTVTTALKMISTLEMVGKAAINRS